ncbi:hypothetical protein GGR54DRAFT_606040 [Hypoxylon sp. NC1633]|nr:hypothetical protein GGR54DRAFT_606040 [Hypoxylon sp. NC1633]
MSVVFGGDIFLNHKAAQARRISTVVQSEEAAQIIGSKASGAQDIDPTQDEDQKQMMTDLLISSQALSTVETQEASRFEKEAKKKHNQTTSNEEH